MTLTGRKRHAGLVFRSIRHLRPGQIAARPWLGARRRLIATAPTLFLGSTTGRPSSRGWPARYQALDADLTEGAPGPRANATGTFEFLHERVDLGNPIDWGAPGTSHLWRFHLHYFEWAWAFAAEPDRDWARGAFASLWRSWADSSPIARGDAWSPYVASLRAWVLCSIWDDLVAGSPIEAEVATSLDLHARYITALRERQIRGNHLVKNLKALVGLGVFLGDDRRRDHAARWLGREVRTQVLDDGGHYERSPSYHCQVLGDLLDVDRLLEAAGAPPVPGLGETIDRMRTWLGAILMPDGDIPLLGDSAEVGARRLAALTPHPPPAGRVTHLAPSGYVVVRDLGPWYVVMDVGSPGPAEQPGHGHAAALSLVVAVDAERVLVDTGTSTYELGTLREHERSTAAHNTVEVDGENQSELWRAFRLGSRATVSGPTISSTAGEITITAAHNGYRRLGLPVTHRRTVSMDARTLRVDDELHGHGEHRAVARWIVAPDQTVATAPTRLGPLAVEITAEPVDPVVALEPVEVATGFGQQRPSSAMLASVEGTVPLTIRSVFRIDEG